MPCETLKLEKKAAESVIIVSSNFELACLTKEEEGRKKRFWVFDDFLFWYFHGAFSCHWESCWS